MPWYKTGTVSVTTGSNVVTGVGTNFAANARVGDGFNGPDGDWYEITNIASETVLAIFPAYKSGSISTSSDYMIAPLQGYNKESADRLRAITDTLTVVSSVAGKTGDVELTKSDVGLSNVDNTSDLNKPVSTATQTAIANNQAQINTINGKISNVDNTSDLNKPVSTATQTAIAALDSSVQTKLDGKKNNFTILPITQGGTGRNDGLPWGSLKGTLTDQTDLVNALSTKPTGSRQALLTAFALFIGSGPTLINNLNVSSITKVTTGIFDINFATPMDHTSFSVIGMASDDNAVQSIVYENGNAGSTRTVNKVRIVTGVPGGTTRDFSLVSVLIAGGKN